MNLLSRRSLLYRCFIRFNERISETRYEIGIIDNCEYARVMSKVATSEVPFSTSEFKVHWLKHKYKDRWFADPFILSVSDNEIILLAEEYAYATGKGRISKLTVSKKDYHLQKVQVVLEKVSHLSFPAILRKGKKVYIYPENCHANQLSLYEADDSCSRLKYVDTLIRQPLTDAVIHKEFVFSTKQPMATGKELQIYQYDKDLKQYILYQRVLFGENIARNGGDIFDFGGILYRPAQECNHSYGHCIVLQELCMKQDKEWSFTERCRLYSPHSVFKEGMHTFNVYNNFCAIDVKGVRNPRMKKCVLRLQALLRKRHSHAE